MHSSTQGREVGSPRRESFRPFLEFLEVYFLLSIHAELAQILPSH